MFEDFLGCMVRSSWVKERRFSWKKGKIKKTTWRIHHVGTKLMNEWMTTCKAACQQHDQCTVFQHWQIISFKLQIPFNCRCYCWKLQKYDRIKDTIEMNVHFEIPPSQSPSVDMSVISDVGGSMEVVVWKSNFAFHDGVLLKGWLWTKENIQDKKYICFCKQSFFLIINLSLDCDFSRN